jgi:4-oxalocrotonate tautomerase
MAEIAPSWRLGLCLTANIRREGHVPEVIVYAVEGRTPKQKKALMKDITDAVVKNFGTHIDAVTVQIVESPRTDKSKGGVPFSER